MESYEKQRDGWGVGPEKLVLIGPPGTGKTRTALEDFILPALRECDPDKVLACSFSNAAADELRARLAASLGCSPERLRETCSTLHSEALRRYKRFGDPNPKLYDPGTRTSKPLKREIAPDTTAAEVVDLWSAAADAWDYIRSLRKEAEPKYGGVCNARRFTRGGKFMPSELIACIEAFEADKARDGSIDFTDMLTRALRYEGRELDLLLVDEANDCTPLQWALIDHWATRAARVVLIGDHDQAIHRWMGASPELLLRRVREWPARVLSQSWRVPVAAHAAARWLITRVTEREDAEYLPREHTGSVQAIGADRVIERLHELCRAHADMPEEWVNGEPVQRSGPSAFVLARTNMRVSGLRRKLNDAGVPYPFAPATAARVFAVVALCRGLPVDDRSVNLLCAKLPARYFAGKKKDALAMDNPAAALRRDLFAEGQEAAVIGDIQGMSGNRGYWLKVCDRYPPWILRDPPPIQVMTMHASKGMESDVVFVDATKPYSVERVDDDELRLLYVACTRTRDELYIFGEGYDELYHAAEQASTTEVPF